MKPIAKHQQISQQLAAEIASGKHSAKGRLPSEAKLVARFGVSRPTVGRALRDLQEQGLIERRAGSGTYLGSSGTDTRRSAFQQLGLILPGSSKVEIFEAICGELASLARVHDYHLLWGVSAQPGIKAEVAAADAEALAEQFIDKGVQGVFFAPLEHTPDSVATNGRIAGRLRLAGIPVVLLDRDLGPLPLRSDFDVVGLDNFLAGYLLAEHLIKLGMKRIAFFARPHSAPTADLRIAGVREALLHHGADPARNWITKGEPDDQKTVRNLALAREWDAIICVNDETAALLMRSLEKAGLKVPLHVRVVGCDDSRHAALLHVPLTTIHQPCTDIALTAFRAMLERLAEPTLPARTLLLPPRLVVRESCGAYLPRSA